MVFINSRRIWRTNFFLFFCDHSFTRNVLLSDNFGPRITVSLKCLRSLYLLLLEMYFGVKQTLFKHTIYWSLVSLHHWPAFLCLPPLHTFSECRCSMQKRSQERYLLWPSWYCYCPRIGYFRSKRGSKIFPFFNSLNSTQYLLSSKTKRNLAGKGGWKMWFAHLPPRGTQESGGGVEVQHWEPSDNTQHTPQLLNSWMVSLFLSLLWLL